MYFRLFGWLCCMVPEVTILSECQQVQLVSTACRLWEFEAQKQTSPQKCRAPVFCRLRSFLMIKWKLKWSGFITLEMLNLLSQPSILLTCCSQYCDQNRVMCYCWWKSCKATTTPYATPWNCSPPCWACYVKPIVVPSSWALLHASQHMENSLKCKVGRCSRVCLHSSTQCKFHSQQHTLWYTDISFTTAYPVVGSSCTLASLQRRMDFFSTAMSAFAPTNLFVTSLGKTNTANPCLI